jgi:N,N-dimethylformamidase
MRPGSDGLRSPVPGVRLGGYFEEPAVTGGETAELKLSGDGPAELEVVRMIHGDPNPDGPGVKSEPAGWEGPRELSLGPQVLDLGSYIEIPDAPWLAIGRSMTLGLWIYPTRLTGDWQAIAAKWAPGDIAFGLFCAGHGLLVAGVSYDGERVEWCTGRQFVASDTWQHVAMVLDGESGTLSVHHHAPDSPTDLERRRRGGQPTARSSKRIAPGSLHASGAPLLLGALADDETGRHRAHFNGKLAAPVLLGAAADAALLDRLRDGEGVADAPDLRGAWDFSAAVTTARAPDLSEHGHDALLVNCPTRAVTGPAWAGTEASVYTDDPARYDAVHLHDDDLGDAGWSTTCVVRPPADARPGIYVARVRTERDAISLPLVVRGSSPRAPVCVVIPTLTWQAYSSNRGPYSFTEDGMVDEALCLYDTHSDGSTVSYASRRKPTRSGDPSAGIRQWGAHTVPANLYLIDWLEHTGQPYDVLCDQHLHDEGAEALRPYRCIVLGSHPEYWTAQMLDALERYLDDGGRCLYLGGNGLYWVTSLDPERPFVMEVRKSGDGDYEAYFARPQPGQMQHSTTLEVGGLWSRRGRPARRLIGVEHSANVFTDADGRWGFDRLPASYDPRFAFVFEGVGDGPIGDFGLNLGTAAAYEMDSVQEWRWPADWTPTVLARAAHESFIAPMRMPVPAVSEIAMTASTSGAAVFSAGSVTWTGSLSHGGYDNNVARITGNVLRRFLDVPAGEPVLPAP